MHLRKLISLITFILLLSPLTVWAQREMAMSLDGNWDFRFAADDRGMAEQWYTSEVTYDQKIQVPGCWDAQGVGEPTDKMWHNAIGVGWYRREITLPAKWQEQQVWLRVGGVHRSARIWVNGQLVGEHIGYPVAFRLNITSALKPAGPQQVVIAVDSRRDASRDPLMGAFDIMDYMDLTWGGIFEQVTLEATGDAWIEDAFAAPDASLKSATLQINTDSINTDINDLRLRYTVRELQNGKPGKVLARDEVAIDGNNLKFPVSLPNAPLWTPEQPDMLVAQLELRQNEAVKDKFDIRFGMRRLECTDTGFLLNGNKFFLRGYGDDYTFPIELAAPASVDFWKKYLLRRKEFGFNGVRHHSTMMSASYLTAADEVGVFVQPELPIVYQPFLDNASPEARKLYVKVWDAYIRQMRNHPSVFAWCMGNELYNGLEMGPALYATAKQLDPTRPVIDTDGMPVGTVRPTLDYHPVQFNEWAIPWGTTSDKHHPKGTVHPTLVHEMSNLSVLPNPADIPLYNGAIKPFWLQNMVDAVKRQGLGSYLPEMLQASRKLQASLLKLNIEDARLSPLVDGYHQWLFRDYWTQSTGFVDQFDRTRALTPAMARQFNSEAVILWKHDKVSFKSGENLTLSLYLSDFRPSRAEPLKQVRATLGETQITLQAPQNVNERGLVGPWTGELQLPVISKPAKLMLEARCGEITNTWPVWVFPKAAPPPSDVLVTTGLTDRVLDRLQDGATVLLTGDSGIFPTVNASFKTAWWKGDEVNDHCYGNMFLKHPALGDFPTDGYGDLQTYNLLNNRPVVLLDEIPGQFEPIVWCLDVPWRMARKAYLFEAKVGRGRLLVSTMNLSPQAQRDDPAVAWMFNCLAKYAASAEFKPQKRLPMSWLRQRVTRFMLPDATTWVEGYARLITSTEGIKPWHSYREDNITSYPVRQTDGYQRIAWQTSAIPAAWPHKTVTFAWAGGIGWRSEPDGGAFTLTVNDKFRLDFPFTTQSTRWANPDGTIKLDYVVRRSDSQDTFGLFFLTLPATELAPGKPVEIDITAPAGNSQRWVSLVPYTDVVASEAPAM